MIVPAPTDLVMIGLAVVGLVGTLVYVIRGGRIAWVVIALGLFTAVAITAAVIAIAAPYVVKVSGDGTGKLQGERGLQLFGDGTSIVINETDRPLVVHAAVYADMPFGAQHEPDDVDVPPHATVKLKAFVDHIGPDDGFPEQVEVDSNTSTSSTTQYWLTW